MRVERFGQGDEGFLCLHGWNGSHRTFLPLAGNLPKHVALWCPDIPGGESLAEITDSLEILARRIPGPLRIVGNCSGALFGLLLAERLRAAEIVMVDAFAYWPLYFRVFLLPVFGRYAYLSAFANPLGRWLSNACVARHRQKTTDLTAGFRGADHEATYRQLQLLTGMGGPERFRPIRSHVQIVYGAKSFGAVRKSASIWRGIFPAAEVHELPGAGHLPLLEAAAPLRSIIFFGEKPCSVL